MFAKMWLFCRLGSELKNYHAGIGDESQTGRKMDERTTDRKTRNERKTDERGESDECPTMSTRMWQSRRCAPTIQRLPAPLVVRVQSIPNVNPTQPHPIPGQPITIISLQRARSEPSPSGITYAPITTGKNKYLYIISPTLSIIACLRRIPFC